MLISDFFDKMALFQGPCMVSMKKFKDFSRTKIIFSRITKIRFLPYKLTIPK